MLGQTGQTELFWGLRIQQSDERYETLFSSFTVKSEITFFLKKKRLQPIEESKSTYVDDSVTFSLHFSADHLIPVI